MERSPRPGATAGVATSKFAVPRRRADVVRRPRLNALIDTAIGGKGILIAAPAGYGKTTLAVDWLQTSDFAAVWLSLDAWDAELPVFARALASAIRLRFDIDVPLGDDRFWQPRTVSTVLINAVAEQDDYVVLVLDDVHTVESSAEVMETLGYLLERAPENLHIVMTSRTRPPIPSLSRLMARREVATIGVADLAFTPREVRELLGSLGRSVSEDEAEMLFERTEGWAAALILGAGSDGLRSGRTSVEGEDAAGGAGSIAGPNVGLSLADYVHGEALDTVPENLREFLRSIALLPLWTPALCNDITGRRDSEKLLKELASSVLFLTQHADEPPSYRCHQLMRSLLMQQFRSQDPDAFREAGRDAAETLTRFGMLNEAVELLFDLEEWDHAADTLAEIAPRLLQQGQARGLAEWIDRLPREAQQRSPHLLVWRARASMKLRDLDEALRLIEDVVRTLREAADTNGLVQALFVRGETQRMKGYNDEALATFGEARTLLEFAEEDDQALAGHVLRNIGVTHTLNGDLDAAIDELEEARRLLEQVGDLEGIGNTCCSLAQCYSRRGEPLQALGALQRAQSAFERAGNTFDLGLTLNNTGMVYYELGEFEQALQVYERGLRLMRGTGNVSDEAFMMAGMAETYRAMGRFEESLAMYQEVQPIAAGLQIQFLMTEITEGLALTRLGLGQGEEAAQLAKSVAPKASESPARIAQHAMVNAQIALDRGDVTAALKAADLAWRHLEPAENRHQMAIASFLRARAFFDGHQPRKAMTEIEGVARLCEKLGYRRFLRPFAVRAKELVEYALIRHVADGLLTDLSEDAAVATRAGSSSDRSVAPTSDMLPAVRAFAFGRGAVLVGERQVSDLEWRSEKSKEMFFLLLSKEESVAKEEIFAALWPDLPESKCNSNFHSSLYRLRRALFHECVVRDGDGGYMLNPKGVFTSDVHSFNQAMLEAEVAKDDAGRGARLEEAVALYKGPFLASTYSEWVDPVRRELEDRYIEALNELAARKLREGTFEEALTLFKALEAVDPYSEAAAIGVMRCHLSLNDGASAARHYRRFRQLLKDELDEEPSERLGELYREAAARG
ncbi:MAG: tetratricopeptide repeat protein [Chloroflexi bacterium]|nr:tetratricopeptide repeat protein [Chloroflexota bacterium]